MDKILIRDLPDGCIIWFNGDILGITGSTVPDTYLDNYAVKLPGNSFDYNMIVRG